MLPLLAPTVWLITGILLACMVPLPPLWTAIGVAASCAAAVAARRTPTVQSLLTGMACALLGATLYSYQQQTTPQLTNTPPSDHAVIIASDPVVRGKTLSMDALLATTGDKIQLRLMRDERSNRLSVGDGLVFHAAVKPLSAKGSYLTYLTSHGYVGEAFVWHGHWQAASIPTTGLSRMQRSRLFFLGLRHQLLQHLRTLRMDDDTYALATAMALGNKSAVAREQRDTFSATGTSHLLALSGLHLGIIYMLLTLLFRRRRRRMVSQLLIVASVWAFVLLVGMMPSVVRAALMISIWAFVDFLGRGRSPLNTLSLTAIAMLTANPSALFDVGFQLSFCSVLAILLFAPPLTELLNRLLHIRPSGITGRAAHAVSTTTAVSVAAQLGTAPLVAFHFGQLSPYFLLANYAAIPLTTLILYLTLAVLVSSWWGWLLSVVVAALTAVVNVLKWWLEWIASWPGASVGDLHPTALQTVAAYVLIGSLYGLLRYSLRTDRYTKQDIGGLQVRS
ncbi:MAG: ComEC/Rec2 family competence protein [Prevotella sp.]|nr:ComEC/Rec2 family competence protein [Prevotella sp.]